MLSKEWRTTELRVASWLRKKGLAVHNIFHKPCPFDIFTDKGTRIEVKSSNCRSSGKYGYWLWAFNIHRHGKLNESKVDFYILRCEFSPQLKEIGFNSPVHIVLPAPIGKRVLTITPRYLIAKWSKHIDDVNAIKTFDKSLTVARIEETLEMVSHEEVKKTPSRTHLKRGIEPMEVQHG